MSQGESRREFLANLAMAATVIPGFGVGAGYVVRYLIPMRERRVGEVLIEKTGRLPVGSSRLFRSVLGNDLIALRVAEDTVAAFSSICTHLGCHVQWDAIAGNFLCPCHMGRFDTSGKVIAGPPPAPLVSFPTRIEGDSIFVTVPVKEA
jgi:cytochrome b6-f complex iron-sulfur subunit